MIPIKANYPKAANPEIWEVLVYTNGSWERRKFCRKLYIATKVLDLQPIILTFANNIETPETMQPKDLWPTKGLCWMFLIRKLYQSLVPVSATQPLVLVSATQPCPRCRFLQPSPWCRSLVSVPAVPVAVPVIHDSSPYSPWSQFPVPKALVLVPAVPVPDSSPYSPWSPIVVPVPAVPDSSPWFQSPISVPDPSPWSQSLSSQLPGALALQSPVPDLSPGPSAYSHWSQLPVPGALVSVPVPAIPDSSPSPYAVPGPNSQSLEPWSSSLQSLIPVPDSSPWFQSLIPVPDSSPWSQSLRPLVPTPS